MIFDFSKTRTMSFIDFGSRMFNSNNVVSVYIAERKRFYSVCVKTTAAVKPYYFTREYDTRKEAEERMKQILGEEEHEEGEDLEEEYDAVAEEGENLEHEEEEIEEENALGERFDSKGKEEDDIYSVEEIDEYEEEGFEMEEVNEEMEEESLETKLFYICPSKKCKSILPLSLNAFSREIEYYCQCGKEIVLPSNIIACSGFD